jgi:16S rRNA (cytosine967-C5)-methyltransferase
VVLYATCSPVLAETRDVVATVAAARDDVAVEDAAPLLPQIPSAQGPAPNTLQLWPHRHHADAMFVAVMRRVR